MLKQLQIKNLTVFPEASLIFAPGINIIVGENSCGKSHLLKVMYAVIAKSFDPRQTPLTRTEPTKPTQTSLQKAYADKLVAVLRPESLGRLARCKQGAERCKLSFTFANPALDTKFVFS